MNKQPRQQKIQEMFEGFMALQKAIGASKDNFFQKYNLGRSQAQILYAIAHEKTVTVKDIATKMGVTSSAATQMIECLVDQGFVQRSHDNKDRRIVNIQFSPEGKKRFEIFKKDHINRIAELFEVLTDEELEMFIQLPKKVLQKIEATAKTAKKAA